MLSSIRLITVVSQAAPARRLYVERQAVFDWYYGWASGGYVADSKFEKAAGSYSQQQYYYRNCDVAAGTSLSVEKCFYIANSNKDTADTINAQLKAGKNLIFQPGVYHVDKPITVTRENTIILGLGLASIIPDNGDAAMKVSDVGGVSICGIIFDAGNYSETLLTIGEEGCNKDHSENPIVLQDVFYRVGGTGNLGRCGSCLVVNSNDTIIDHTWIWRADHGDHTGWYENTAKNGVVVNGDQVTAYGLFCEHFQEYDILWRGENGKTYFLQNEKCYDPQSQDGWMSHNGEVKGYAAYKVTNNVKNHYAVGLGVYDVFINTNGASIFLENAIEVPDTEGVLIENACIVEIANGSGPMVGINHIVNGTTAGIRTGAEADGGYAVQRLLSYENGASLSLEDYYGNQNGTGVIPENGITPEIDPVAEKEIEKDELTKDEEEPLWNMTDEKYEGRIEESIPEKPTEEVTTKEPTTKEPTTEESTTEEPSEEVTTKGETSVEESTKPQEVQTTKGTTTEKVTKEEISSTKQPENTTEKTTSDNKTVVLKKRQKLTIGKFVYRITKVDGKKITVKITGVRKKYAKNLKKTVIRTKFKYKGYSLKVTAVDKNAFKKTKKLKRITVKGNTLKKVSGKAFRKKAKIKIVANKKIKKLFAKALK